MNRSNYSYDALDNDAEEHRRTTWLAQGQVACIAVPLTSEVSLDSTRSACDKGIADRWTIDEPGRHSEVAGRRGNT